MDENTDTAKSGSTQSSLNLGYPIPNNACKTKPNATKIIEINDKTNSDDCDINTSVKPQHPIVNHINGMLQNNVHLKDNEKQDAQHNYAETLEFNQSTSGILDTNCACVPDEQGDNDFHNCDVDKDSVDTTNTKLPDIIKVVLDDEITTDTEDGIDYVVYESEHQMPDIMRLITKDLSEPYSIYTYRYFIHNWPKLCFLAMHSKKCIGAIVCKLDLHKKVVRRGYIAMLAVDKEYRRRKIGSHLVLKAMRAMISDDCDEVVLETEITNKGALRLYENLGFVRDKRLFRYYLNGVDALRLKLWLR